MASKATRTLDLTFGTDTSPEGSLACPIFARHT